MHFDPDMLAQYAAVLFDDSPLPMVVCDVETLGFLAVNQALLAAYGYTREEFLALSVLTLRPPEDRESFLARFEARRADPEAFRRTGVWRNVRADGTAVEVEVVRSREFTYFGRAAYIATLFDLSERRAHAEHVIALSYRDEQTGLPNRAALFCGECAAPGAIAGVVLVHTKWVAPAAQRSYELLTRAANEAVAKIRTLLPREAVLVRYAEEVFGIVMPATARNRSLVPFAKKLVEGLVHPLRAGEDEMVLMPSAGIAPAGPDAQDLAMLFRQAECALDSAQRDDDRVVAYDEGLDSVHHRRALLERHLRHAVAKRRVDVAYQPIVALHTGRIVAAEALMRWDCPGVGPVPPVEFIAIAEESGIILKLGEWILREACAQARRWELDGHAIRVAVNVSAHQVQQRDFVRLVSSICEATSLNPALLELELTESTMMRHDGVARRNLEGLRRMGTRISIDDFGTGYSSLSYLNTLPLDTLKIDRSFIAAITEDDFQADVTRSVIALAHRRGLSVVAEGVEKAEQVADLATMACDEVQGFLLGVPSGAAEFTALLERERLSPLTPPYDAPWSGLDEIGRLRMRRAQPA